VLRPKLLSEYWKTLNYFQLQIAYGKKVQRSTYGRRNANLLELTLIDYGLAAEVKKKKMI
jgi:hypothetical protein